MLRKDPPSWLTPGIVLVTVVLVGWAVLAASQAAARSFNLFLYLLANLIVFMDVIDFVLRLYFRRLHFASSGPGHNFGTSVALDIAPYTPYQRRLHLRPYALLVSVYNAENQIDAFLESMAPYRDHVWLIDDASTDNTCRRIRQSGWRILDGEVNRKKPGAIRNLLQKLPPEIETVMVLDPDISIRDSKRKELSYLEDVIFEFQRSGMAAACPRITIRQDGFLDRLQGLEYCMSFSLGRSSLADHGINSGISIYRRDALVAAMQKHSLSVYAEDLENTAILLGDGERIYCDARLIVETEGKPTWHTWFSQRVGWAFGLIKVYCEHFSEIRSVARRNFIALYQYVVYMGGFSLLLHPLKLVALGLLSLSIAKTFDALLGISLIPDWAFAEPVYFLAAYSKFSLLALGALFVAVPRGERLQFLPVVPLYFFYSLAQIIPSTVGYADWICVKLLGRRIWGDHYQDQTSFLQTNTQDRATAAIGVK